VPKLQPGQGELTFRAGRLLANQVRRQLVLYKFQWDLEWTEDRAFLDSIFVVRGPLEYVRAIEDTLMEYQSRG
jgi:hypothetical protein